MLTAVSLFSLEGTYSLTALRKTDHSHARPRCESNIARLPKAVFRHQDDSQTSANVLLAVVEIMFKDLTDT